MEKVRILQVVTTMDFGGVETLLMELYRNIDRNKIQFDFLCHNTVEGKYCNEILKLGGKIYSIKNVNRCISSFIYEKRLTNFFNKHKEYKIVHCHINGYNGYVLKVAKKCGIDCRISHSHIANRNVNPIINYHYYKSMKLINDNVTDYFACSLEAAKFLYKDINIVGKSVIFNNCINTEKFKFNLETRNKLRTELGLQDSIVYIQVGRFMDQKNHCFTVDIFNEIVRTNGSSKLLLIGDGPLRKQIERKVDDLSLKNNVIFLGSKSNICDYLSASDVFLFPSLYEGLGIVAIEAQCSGLYVFASNKVPSEVKQTELLSFISLDDDADKWSNQIMQKINNCHDSSFINERYKYSNTIKNSGYDVKEKAKWLENFYIKKVYEN